jgi:hypothetical protein
VPGLDEPEPEPAAVHARGTGAAGKVTFSAASLAGRGY